MDDDLRSDFSVEVVSDRLLARQARLPSSRICGGASLVIGRVHSLLQAPQSLDFANADVATYFPKLFEKTYGKDEIYGGDKRLGRSVRA